MPKSPIVEAGVVGHSMVFSWLFLAVPGDGQSYVVACLLRKCVRKHFRTSDVELVDLQQLVSFFYASFLRCRIGLYGGGGNRISCGEERRRQILVKGVFPWRV